LAYFLSIDLAVPKIQATCLVPFPKKASELRRRYFRGATEVDLRLIFVKDVLKRSEAVFPDAKTFGIVSSSDYLPTN
jgi:hypothetical protein